MSQSSPEALHWSVPIPLPGGSVRWAEGGWQLVAERQGEDLTLVAHNGREGVRLTVPVPAVGLEISVAKPQHPIEVVVPDLPEIKAGARLRGYLTLPLALELWAGERLALVRPRRLRTAWVGAGGYVGRVEGRFVAAKPEATATMAVIPVLLRNPSARPWQPGRWIVRLTAADWRVRGERLVGRGQRLVRPSELPQTPLRLALAAVLFAAVMAGCGPGDGPDTPALLGEIRALRNQVVGSPVAALEPSFGPVMAAQGDGGDATNVKLDDLRKRVAELEQAMREATQARHQQEALMVRALDSMTARLDRFLQRAQALRPEAEVPVKGSGAWPWVLGIGILAVVVALVAAWRRRRSRRPETTAFARCEADAERGALAPVEGLAATIAVGRHPEEPLARPEEICWRLAHAAPARVELAVAQLLADDPCVLVEPVPQVEASERHLEVRFSFVPDATDHERAQFRERLEQQAGAASSRGRFSPFSSGSSDGADRNRVLAD